MAFLQLVAAAAAARPNFVLVMCDDLDKQLGGVGAIPQVAKLLGSGGATADNYFVSSPKCTPSRAAWLIRSYPPPLPPQAWHFRCGPPPDTGPTAAAQANLERDLRESAPLPLSALTRVLGAHE